LTNLTENILMRVILQLVILVSLSAPAVAQEPPVGGSDSIREFQVKKETSEERVADFYTRLILLERESVRREEGAEDMRKERQKFSSELEKARREYRRPEPVDNEDGAKAYEKQMAEKRRLDELERKDYVRRRDEMRKWEKGLGTVPENTEYGLENLN
jgi:hypothetical protein